MTIAYLCDGPECEKTLGKDNRRISLLVENEEMAPATWDEIEPDQQLHIELIPVGFEADRHFCSMQCLTSWAYAQHLEEPA